MILIEELKYIVKEWDEATDKISPNAANLAMSIAAESARLLELFQWEDLSGAHGKAAASKHEVLCRRLGRVILECLRVCNIYDIDLVTCVVDKLHKNRRKYPQLPEPEFDGKSDGNTGFPELFELIDRNNAGAGWQGLNVANLTMSVCIEAGELLEIFKSADYTEAHRLAHEDGREHFLEELADVLIYALDIAIGYDVDVPEAVIDLLEA